MRSFLYAFAFVTSVFVHAVSGQSAYDQYKKARDLKNEDNQQALIEMNKAIELGSKDKMVSLSDYYKDRAEILTELGRYKEAAEDYTRVIKTSGIALYYHSPRAEMYCKAGNYAEAIADYTASLPWKDWDARSRGSIIASRARCHLRNGRKDLAKADINLSLATYPKSGLAYNLRGHLLMAEGKTELALADFTEAVVNGDGIAFERDRSAARIKLGKTQLAYDHVNVLITNSYTGGDDRYFVHRGELALKLGRHADALKDATQVIDRPRSIYREWARRDKREALTLRAAVYCAMGKQPAAAADEAELIKLGGKIAKPCTATRGGV